MGNTIKNLFKLIAANDDLSYLGNKAESNPVNELIKDVYKDAFQPALFELRFFSKFGPDKRTIAKKEMLEALDHVSKDVKVNGVEGDCKIYFSFGMLGDYDKLPQGAVEFASKSCNIIVKLIYEQAGQGHVNTIELAQEYLDKLIGLMEEELGDRIINLAIKNAKLLIEYAESGKDKLGLLK